MTFHGRLITALAIAAGLATPATAAPPIPISSCDAEVPAGRTGVLTGDIQCLSFCSDHPAIQCDPGCPVDPDEGCDGQGIRLGRGSKLKLDGHTIHGAYNTDAIQCFDAKPGGTCTVTGPGEVQSDKGSAIASGAMNVRVRDLRMEGSYGAISTTANVDVRRSEFASWDSSIYEARSIRLVDVVNGQDGLLHATDKISLKNVRTASAVESDGRIVGRNVTLVGFGASCPSVDAPKVRISGLTADGCTP